MSRVSVVVVLAMLVAGTGCGGKAPEARVSFRMVSQPKGTLDPSHMDIAIRAVKTQVEGTGAGDGGNDEAKWGEMTADILEHYFQEAAEKHSVPLRVVDRQHLKETMEEKDLAAAGITDTGDAVASSQLKGATAILTSKVTVKIDKQKGKGRTMSAASLFGGGGHGWGGGGGSMQTEEVEKESRNISVQCQFQLKDPATNDILIAYTSLPSQEHERNKTSFLFGSSKTEADMNPRDQVIGEMVSAHVNRFLGKFLPVETETEVVVKAGKSDESKAGVRSINAEDFEAALGHFKAAIAEQDSDHHSYFGAGVCCEKLNRYDEARKYYKQAASYDSKEEMYEAAVRRVSDMKS